MKSDTIASVATALTDSGVIMIRVSGDQSVEIVDKLFYSPSHMHILGNAKSHTIHYGFIYDGEELVDEVLVSVMLSPKSYTTEDTIEINCHGGVLLANHILDLLIRHGARLAEPGEFTKRAFLNGRIDLSKAEAVMDLISSQNDFAMKSSISQLSGSLSDLIKKLRKEIIHQIAFIESAIDDPEHISLDGYNDTLLSVVNEVSSSCKNLLDHADEGIAVKEGIKTVILGKPNAGKSSLLNKLTGQERAIVTNVAGTTRDVLEEFVRIRGIGLRVLDTAGIHETEDVVEKIGVDKALEHIKDSDLCLYVVDSSTNLDENDFKILSLIKDKKTIIVWNKIDLRAEVDEQELLKKTDGKFPIVKISTLDESGIDQLKDKVYSLFFHGEISFKDHVYITNMRHKEAILEAYDSLKQVKISIENQMPEDFYYIDLMNAYSSLGKIIGEEVGEDLINEIFSSFCMGK